MSSILFKKTFPLSKDLKHFLHACRFFSGGKTNIPVDVSINLGLDLSLNPELQVGYFKAAGQSVYFVYNNENPVLALVNKAVDLFNLAALEVSDIYHIHYD